MSFKTRVLLNDLKENTTEDFIKKNPCYESLIALSPMVENAISFIDFKQGKRALIIGASYGAYARYLVSQGVSVVCIEEDKDSADVIRYLYPEVELVDNNADIQYEQYDYVIVDRKSELFVSEIINKAKDKIEKLIILSNNIIHDLSMNHRVYYPYPNIDFPYEIYSDRRLPKFGELHIINCPKDSKNISYTMRDDLLEKSVKDGFFDKLIGNYIYVCQCKDDENSIALDDMPNFIKYSCERISGYNTITYLCSDKVIKKAYQPEDNANISRINKIYETLNNLFQTSRIKINKCNMLTDSEIELELVKGNSIESMLDDFLYRKDKNSFENLIKQYVNIVKTVYLDAGVSSDDSESVESDNNNTHFTLVKNLDIDLIFQNIIVDENIWHAIDYEWTFEEPKPLEWLFYRAITYYYYQSRIVKNEYELDELVELVDLNKEQIEEFQKIEDDFQNSLITSSTRVTDCLNDYNYLSREDFHNHLLFTCIDSDGKVLEKLGCISTVIKGNVDISLDVPSGTKQISVNTAITNAIVIFKSVKGFYNGKEVNCKLISKSYDAEDGVKIYQKSPFQFELLFDTTIDEIYMIYNICYSMAFKAEDTVLYKVQTKLMDYNENKKWKVIAEERLDIIENQEKALHKVYNSLIWKIFGRFVK